MARRYRPASRRVKRRASAARGRRDRDLADVQHLLRLPGVNRAEMRAAFERAGLEERFDEIDRRP